MSPQQAAEITSLKDQLANGMEDYLKDAGTDAGYAQKDIANCLDIIDTYLVAVDRLSEDFNAEPIMAEVQTAVLKLNQLNEKCRSGLIETEQREQLCEIIAKAARFAGLEFDEDDLTEEWREW